MKLKTADASVIVSAFAFSDIETKLTATNCVAFAKGGAIVAGDDMTVTTAVGGTVFVRSNSIGIKKYDIVLGDALYYIKDSTVTWEAKTGEAAFATVTAASQVLKGDKFKLSFKIVNNTAEDKTFTLVVAVYNDDGLI